MFVFTYQSIKTVWGFPSIHCDYSWVKACLQLEVISNKVPNLNYECVCILTIHFSAVEVYTPYFVLPEPREMNKSVGKCVHFSHYYLSYLFIYYCYLSKLSPLYCTYKMYLSVITLCCHCIASDYVTFLKVTKQRI